MNNAARIIRKQPERSIKALAVSTLLVAGRHQVGCGIDNKQEGKPGMEVTLLLQLGSPSAHSDCD